VAHVHILALNWKYILLIIEEQNKRVGFRSDLIGVLSQVIWLEYYGLIIIR